jgi:hypothetical protein
MIDDSSGPSRAEQLLKIVQRFKACTRAYLRAPHQSYSVKVLRLCLERITSHLSEHYGLPQAIEKQRITLLMNCITVRREIDVAGAESTLSTTATKVRALGGEIDTYEKLLKRYARPCSIS